MAHIICPAVIFMFFAQHCIFDLCAGFYLFLLSIYLQISSLIQLSREYNISPSKKTSCQKTASQEIWQAHRKWELLDAPFVGLAQRTFFGPQGIRICCDNKPQLKLSLLIICSTIDTKYCLMVEN